MSNASKHKMYDYEVNPPASAWKKIAEALDESDLAYEYPSRLRGVEVIPPAALWTKIAAGLNVKEEKVIPVRKRISPFIRYAAAAAIIAFLAWGGTRMLNKKSSKDEIVNQDPVPATTNPENPTTEPVAITPGDEIVSNNPTPDDEARNDAALEESKKTYAKHVPARSKVKNAAGFHFSITSEPLPPVNMDPATRYIMLMTPDGNIIRMSKKLRDLVCCVSGEEQDAGCVDQMKKWREKVASSSMTYSPGNFGDILNLVKALQE